MLYLLIILIIRKLRSKNLDFNLMRLFKQLLLKVKYVFPFLLISMTLTNNEVNKEERIVFDIINKGNNVGYIIIEKSSKENTTIYNVNSEVETQFIIKFKAEGKERSVYRNDTLIYSSIYRKLNNKIKVNQTLKFKKGSYAILKGKNESSINLNAITCNLVVLFFEEPLGVEKVYCDKLKKELNIIKLAKGKYKVKFPNGSYNVFNYKNGQIAHIDAVGSFYKVTLTKHQ